MPKPEAKSVYAAFQETVKEFGSRPFLRVPLTSCSRYSDSAIEFTYATANESVQQLIESYAGLEVDEGKRVALAFDARVDVFLHLLAINALGGSVVALNSSATDNELFHVISHSDSSFVVGLAEFSSRLNGLVEKIDDCKFLRRRELLACRGEVTLKDNGSKTEAALLYTSGTTGKPKGCMLSNEFFVRVGRWYNEIGGLCALSEGDRLVTPLPLNHMNALCASFMGMLMCGGCVIQLDRFHPSTWWQTVRDESATVIHCLGAMSAILMALPEQINDDFSGLVRFGFAPGTDPQHHANFEYRFGFPMIDAWSMTETGSGGIAVAHEEPRRVGERCVGKPVSTMEYRLVDEYGIDVAAGEPGELLVRSKGGNPRRYFFSGYYKDESATEGGWIDGWWHTGDVLLAGTDGLLYFVDRRKNLIRRSGENISAAEIEAVIVEIDGVDNCSVCAVPDDMRGEEVFAFVVGESEDAIQIFSHCRKQLSYFKTPGYIAFVTELPVTDTQKIKKSVIQEMARNCVDELRCVDVRDRKRRRSKKDNE